MSSDPSIGLMNDLLDICECVIKGRIAPADGFKKIEDYHDRDPSTPSILLDVLSMVDLEAKDDENQKKLFTELAKLAMNDVVPEECVRAELECMDAGTQANRLQIIRTKTKLFSPSYSKLITELLSVDDTLPASTIAQRMLSLIGTFSLDPNRALDILLEAFERLPSRRSSFVEILKEMQTTAEYLQTFLVWKFTLYQTDKSVTPFSLYRLAAALIEEKLVEQDDIVKYLAPCSSDLMESHKARAALASVRSKKAETIIASNVAIDPHKHSSVGQDGQELAQITGISFAAVTGVQEAEDAKLRGDDEKVLGCNQKVGLVTALLEDGQWERAKRITDCMPEHYAVQASKRAACAVADMVDATISDLFHLKCAQGLADADWRKENGGGKWDRTADRRRDERSGGGKRDITVSCWDDFDVVFELLAAVGPRVAYRSRTLTKLVRLCTVFFEEKAAGAYGTGPEISNKMMDLIDEILLPGLSLSESNVALSEEIWSLISQFPYEQRYRLYGRWKTVHTTRHPELTIERGKTIGRTKYVIKRLSKDTVKMMGRILGKLAHTHPSFVFDYLLGQVQTFDNLIHPVVDALRFLTNLELDVLLFCVLEQLASPSKESLKASDGTTSSWLISLATMVGALLKKYTIELAPVLDYVSMQLRNNKSADLLILNEMLHSMAGIEKAAQATQEHIEALSGGELLRQEAGSYGSSIRNKKAAVRLRDAILKEDLAVGLSILVAQQRDAILYQGSKEMPLKLTGEMADQCRDTLVQFSSFLLENMKAEEYARKYSLPVDAAFFLARPAFRYEVQSVFDAKKKEMRAKEKKEKEREAAGREEGEEKEKEKDKKERRQMDAVLKVMMYNEAIDEVVTRLGERLEPLLRKMIRAEISAKTYVLFWMLESYDLEVPSAAYEREAERIRKAIAAVGDSAEFEEHSRQTEHVTRVKSYLQTERENLFKNTPNAILSLLHTCILPRAMFGESDAIFAAKFVLLMHTQRTIGFQTLFFTDKVMCDILPVVSLLSENEAHSLGRCLQLILSQHAAWHEDAGAYEKECTGTPGFQLRLKKPAGKDEQPTKPMGGEHAQHNMHAKLLHKWQSRVGRSLQGALNNTAAEYVHLRNCIVVATKLLPCFPLMKHDADGMEKAAAGVRDREKGRRDDLSLKAASYVVLLKTRKLQLRDSAYFGCKGPPPAPKVAATPAKAAAAPTSATKAKAKVATPAASTAAAAAAPAASAAAGGAAAKNGVKRSAAPAAAAAEEKRERPVKKEAEVKPQPAEVEGPSLPPALAAGTPTGGEEREREEKGGGGGRVVKKTSTEKEGGGAAERPKKRREIEVGAARALMLATGGNKRPKNELDGVVKKDEARNGSARKEEKEQRREESALSARFKRETKREEDEGEDGEVPPSPVKREDDRPSRGCNGSEKEREREREKEREAKRVEKERDRDERKQREDLKAKLIERQEREKEKAKRLSSLGTSGDEKAPPARVDRDKERERDRDKRKNITMGEEPLPKKPRKEKEESRKESRDSREDSKNRRRSQSRDEKPSSGREKEKERGGERGEKERPEKDRGADSRRSKEGRERAKSPVERTKSKHKAIKF
ncbi:thoc-2 [Pristionchus pacificus]|uniref:THO complex subunit 2 n=1 Tax=Pristionchus pacificus TaxID=54126 RepID=A0A2A6CDD6_PRIPA|nr:thoc-2 [Pristionchus pacificus]|eukprot:PDM76255.1 thoc-2 [Pristionchus pacificus]